MNPNLEIKQDELYYSRQRQWPSKFSLSHDTKFLDIGCGQGTLGKYLKQTYRADVTGVEIIEKNYHIALSVLDHVFLGNIEQMDISSIGNDFDYIIFSDSLEHLLEPDRVLENIRPLLKPSGKILLSIPNIRNFRVTLPLIFNDSWEYKEEGLLDKTHLRFFTEKSIITLLKDKGYKIENIAYDLPLPSKVGIMNLLTLGVFRRILTSHIFISAHM